MASATQRTPATSGMPVTQKTPATQRTAGHLERLVPRSGWPLRRGWRLTEGMTNRMARATPQNIDGYRHEQVYTSVIPIRVSIYATVAALLRMAI